MEEFRQQENIPVAGSNTQNPVGFNSSPMTPVSYEKPHKPVWIVVFVIVIVLVIIGIVVFFGNGEKPLPDETATLVPPTELGITVIIPGEGEPVVDGDRIAVRYRGFVYGSQNEFVSNFDDTEPPFVFVVGSGSVIRGLDIGVLGMKRGERREIVVPDELAFGSEGSPDGKIPPDTAVVYQIQLLEILPASE